MHHNFFYWLITSFLDTLGNLIQSSGVMPPHQGWGLVAAMTGYGAELFALCFQFIGTFIRFRTIALVLGIIGLLEASRHFISALKFIRAFLPL